MRKLTTLLAALLATTSLAAAAGNYTSPLYNPYYMDGSGGTSCAPATYTEYSAGSETFSVPTMRTGYVWQIGGSNGSVRTFSCTNGSIDVLDDEGYSDWS